MTSHLFLPDGRSFEAVFATGDAHTTTGYCNAAGDDVGSMFAGGGSDVKSGYYDSSGRDIASLFRLAGDADIRVLTFMAQFTRTGWTEFMVDLLGNSWSVDNKVLGYSVSENFSQDACLYVLRRLKAGCRVVWSCGFGNNGDTTEHTDTNPGGPSFGFEWLQQPDESNAYILRFRLKASDGMYNALSMKLIANVYVN